MSAVSVSASMEAKLLETLRALVPEVRAVGLLETADAGTQKDEDLTTIQVRAYNFVQTREASPFFTLSAEVRLYVEQAESANGGLFRDAHEKIALWLEGVMEDVDGSLDTARAHVDGLQRNGDDKDFDTTTGEWFAVWNVTLSGRIKPTEEQEET